MQYSKIDPFFELVRAGLWGKDVELRKYGTTDFAEVLHLAEEQSVVGLVTAGLERVKDVKIQQEWTLQFIGSTLQLEQRNKAMNAFVASLIKKMREAGIYSLLIKGQGIAQCYEKPLSRQFVVRKTFSMFRRIGDLFNHARIFPLDSLRFSFVIMRNGVKSAVRGEG